MNKKSLILLALPAFLLGGCNKEISAADAKAKAKQIEEHEVKAEDYKALSVATKMSESTSGKVNGTNGNEKMEIEAITEFSVDDSFVHVKAFTKLEDLTKNETKTSSTEMWTYLKDDIFYTATAVSDGSNEQKTYVTVEGVAEAVKAAFKANLDETVKTALDGVSSDTYLDMIENIADGETQEGITYSVKYFSSGDGNLTVEGNATFNDYEYQGIKGNGTGKVKYAWDKYLLSEVEVSMDFNAKDEGTDTDATMKMDMSEKVSFEVRPSYPDLTNFKKVVL